VLSEIDGALFKAWQAMGGPKSSLGMPSGVQSSAGTGQVAWFTSGGALYRGPGGLFVLPPPVATDWQLMGASKSALGAPTSNAQPLGSKGERVVTFQHGVILIGPAGRTTVSDGAVYTAWQKQFGGFGGALGKPTGSVVAINGGAQEDFQNGLLFVSATNKVYVTTGPAYAAYLAHTATLTGFYGLGSPTGNAQALGKGTTVQYFTGGALVASGTKGYVLDGAVAVRWQILRGTAADLGEPTGDTQASLDGSGRISYFSNGVIYVSGSTLYVVYGPVYQRWQQEGGEKHWGRPTANESITLQGGGHIATFGQGAVVYYPSQNVTHITYGAIYQAWLAGGGEQVFGAPTTDEQFTLDHQGRISYYQFGAVALDFASGAIHSVFGWIYGRWQQEGGEANFVLPTSNVFYTPDGAYALATFQKGAVSYDVKTVATHITYGAIYQAWLAGGGVQVFGAPVEDEKNTTDGSGRISYYQHGAIAFAPVGGLTSAIYGPIFDRWQATGGEGGPLGLPTANEQDTSDGSGRIGTFQRGTITWDRATNATHAIYGPTWSKWQEVGGPSTLGLPVSNVQFLGDGLQVVQFQYGRIIWSPTQGIQVIPSRIQLHVDIPEQSWGHVSGYANVTLDSLGNLTVNAAVHDSTILEGYDYTMRLQLTTSDWHTITLNHNGSVAGTLDTGPRDDFWNETKVNRAAAALFGKIRSQNQLLGFLWKR
jgi:uncharacterized protein with LGFP repeats